MPDELRAVHEEMQRFREKLPELLKAMPGEWVVFRAGEVVSRHGDEQTAYAGGAQAFGADGGFVVARVVEEHPQPITAGVLFGRRHR
jgi:hypothetical protein